MAQKIKAGSEQTRFLQFLWLLLALAPIRKVFRFMNIWPICIWQMKIGEKNNECIKFRDLLLKNNQAITMGDEGGFAPKLPSNEKALEYLEMAISSAGYDTNQVKLG